MSRAFVKETDEMAPLPERPLSPCPNYVTEQGLAAIDAELARVTEAFAQAQSEGDRDAQARIGRDLRYWQQRRASAELFVPDPQSDVVQFGSTVTIERDDGRIQTWRIVGEDEADPAKGSISYVAPLARALIGKAVGDAVAAVATEAEITAITQDVSG